MLAKYRPIFGVSLMCLCGCLQGSPNQHIRRHGHQDTTLCVSPQDDVILFNAAGEGGRDLYLLKLADLSVTRVAKTPEYETWPSLSPDGENIVYSAGVPGDRADHIFIMGRDGSGKTQLTSKDANDDSPQFSPNGKLIVFDRDKTHQWGGLAANWEPGGVICVIGADGTGERQLTPDDMFAFEPAFTKDGQAVLFFSLDGLYSVPVDGSARPKKIGPIISFASFSPDRKQLVFSEGEFSPDQELFMADLNGANKAQITSSKYGCIHPVFANSGKRVYFLMEEWPDGKSAEPKSSIWTVKTDGTGQEQLTDLSLFDDPLNWKPAKSP